MADKMTIYEFAEKVGVSIGTVSRVINGRKHVSPATREMVLRQMNALGFQPNRTAAALASGRTQVVSLWTPGLFSTYVSMVLSALEREVESHDFDLMVADVGRKRWDRQKLISLYQWPSDGVIVLDGAPWLDSVAADLSRQGTPVISMGVFASQEVDSVGLDISEGVCDAVRHLAAGGCRRLAYLVPETYMKNESTRFRSYHETMSELGLSPELIVTPTLYRSVTTNAVQDYFRKHGCPDGIFCFNDDFGIAAYRAMRNLDIRVPEDVKLVGCDGIEETEYMERPLSTIVHPIEEMCAESWRLLESRRLDPHAEKQRTVLKSRLVVRESSSEFGLKPDSPVQAAVSP